MKHAITLVILAGSAGAAWLAWNPPAIQNTSSAVYMAMPDTPAVTTGPWRVMTRRMVSKQAVSGMRARLAEQGFHGAQLIQKREPVELHAFDDPRIFETQSQASKVKAEWRALGIEADVLHHLSKDDKPVFKVGLGRFYMSEYAEAMQTQLKKSHKPYSYERRTVNIPSYHFVFPPMSKTEAKALWTRLQAMGAADPVIIQQSEFEAVYANKSAKRSNK